MLSFVESRSILCAGSLSVECVSVCVVCVVFRVIVCWRALAEGLDSLDMFPEWCCRGCPRPIAQKHTPFPPKLSDWKQAGKKAM